MASPGKAPQDASFEPRRVPPVELERLWYYLDSLTPGRPFLLLLPLVEEHELQGVEVGGQYDQVIEVALTEDTHKVVAYLGGQRFRLGEHYSKELLGVFGEKLDLLAGDGRITRKAHRLRRQGGAVGSVVPELRQERRDGVRRSKLS